MTWEAGRGFLELDEPLGPLHLSVAGTNYLSSPLTLLESRESMPYFITC